MEKKYNTLVAIFVAALAISILGFYKTYFQFFPHFKNISFFTHIHFIIFLSWFALLIVQPILIKQKNYKLHKKAGKVSYFLAPIMVVSIIIMVKLNIANNLKLSGGQAAVAVAGATLDSLFFSVFYTLSMVNKNTVRKHVAFLVGACLIILNPGLGRLISALVSADAGILVMVFTPFVTSVSIIMFEKFRLKRPVLKSPYLLVALLWMLEVFLFIIIPGTSIWQDLIRKIAAM